MLSLVIIMWYVFFRINGFSMWVDKILVCLFLELLFILDYM